MKIQQSEFTKLVKDTVRSRRQYNKIFCIGFNKTGTTSLETVLQVYGFKLPNQHTQEVALSRACFKTDYLALSEFVVNYDAFQDLPFSEGLTFVACDSLFPNSKFILTEREPEDWWQSFSEFHKKLYKKNDLSQLTERDIAKAHYLWPGYVHAFTTRLLTTFVNGEKKVAWDLLYDKNHYIDLYVKRNDVVKQYFSNSAEKLLVLDLTREKTTQGICEFLNIPVEMAIAMPHKNRTSEI